MPVRAVGGVSEGAAVGAVGAAVGGDGVASCLGATGFSLVSVFGASFRSTGFGGAGGGGTAGAAGAAAGGDASNDTVIGAVGAGGGISVSTLNTLISAICSISEAAAGIRCMRWFMPDGADNGCSAPGRINGGRA